jgi:hypothetical protein
MTNKPQLDDLEAVRKIVDALTGFASGEQQRILRWVREKVGIPLERDPAAGAGRPNLLESQDPVRKPEESNLSDIKSFIDAKRPSSDNQFAAAVAYYFRFQAPPELRKESITADDLQEACRQAGRSRMSRPAQTLVNAHGQGLLNRGERGTYAINTVGENLVAMTLPSDQGKGIGRKPSKKAAKKRPIVRKKATKR